MTGDGFGAWPGRLEIRAKGGRQVLAGSFPYNTTATVRAGGRTRKERFNSGALSWQVREFAKLQEELAGIVKQTIDEFHAERLAELEDALEKRNTFLLVGHDYNRTIADMKTGTLAVEHTPDAVKLEAELADPARRPSWVEDAVRAVEGGQLRGISPGFNVGAKGGEKLIPEPGNPGVLIREISDAAAYEYSLVARPAYPNTSAAVDQRTRLTASQPRRRRRRLWL